MSIEVIIEISKGSHIKYEYDKERHRLVCDRVLHTPMKYPFNYGFIPNTLSEDGDPVDVVVLMDDALLPGSSVKCRLVGYLETEDDAGNDPKLLACPVEQIDPTMAAVQDVFDLTNSHLLKRVRYFFQHYKDLENKMVRIGIYGDKSAALRILAEAEERCALRKRAVQSNKITNYFRPLRS